MASCPDNQDALCRSLLNNLEVVHQLLIGQ